jgi:D-alanyl-D-alanine carboxypeptidase (penicillin-binding protein 5/6)
MLTPIRAAALGVVLAAAAASTLAAGPASATTRGANVVGGPDLASAGIVVRPGPGATPLPPVVAESWVLADLTTGKVLAAKAPHRLARPASTLKTLTAVTLLPKLDKTTVHTATDAEARAEGGHVGLVPGATYTVWDLWHGLLLPSGNDAAAALANANGGMAATVLDMQAMATRLQANDTTVRNASGLDADGQLSSAYDLALLARAAMGIEDFRTVTKSVRYDFPGKPVAAGATRPTYKIYSQNRLLLHGFKGTVGGKTGFTSLAHRTFWGAASRNGHTLVATLMQIGQPTETAAKSLLTWGFANVDRLTPVGDLVDPLPDTAAPGDSTGSDGGSTPLAESPASSSASSDRGVPGWLWAVGAGLLLGGAVAVLLRRRPKDGPVLGALGGTDTSSDPVRPAPGPVLPEIAHPEPTPETAVRPARPAGLRTSSVVVSNPGRRWDGPAIEPARTVVPTGTVAQSPDPATAPIPRVIAGAAATASLRPATSPAPAAEVFDQDADDATTGVAPAPVPARTPDPARPAQGGHVRVIPPTGRPDSAR